MQDTDITDKEDECELGYWLGKPFWGRGYMPEAAMGLLRHGFETLGMTARVGHTNFMTKEGWEIMMFS